MTTPPDANHDASQDSMREIPLAIVSMACRVPGANNLDEYWDLIRTGGCAIGELPPDRLDQKMYYDPVEGARAKTYSRIGGVVRSGAQTNERFHLTADDLDAADEAHLELLAVAAQAMRRAGWDPHNLPTRRAGVYIGHTRGTGLGGDLMYRSLIPETANYLNDLPQFHELVGEHGEEIIQSIVDQTHGRYRGHNAEGGPKLEAFQASRIVNKAFGLDGPYMALNAACASSLYALAAGATALQTGEIDMAVIGGTSHCKFDSLILFSKAGSISATGSRPFDADADGLVSAEGYVILVLKTLARAVADGDSIEAVIRGIGVSSDGKGKSLWAPREEGQIEALRRAYGTHLRPDRLQYIEAHATSTPVGDATEVKALSRGLAGRIPEGYRIPIGSVKANIGHTLETAGLAGLVKAVLALQHRVIPPTAFVKQPNPKIPWADTPFDLPAHAMDWPAQPDGSPRRAGVNAFGIGGLNAHVVVDEYCPDETIRLLVATPPTTAQRVVTKQAATPPADLAIIGMGAILPGATDWQTFWSRTLQGVSGIVPVPPGRFMASNLPLDASQLSGGYLPDYEYDWRKHKVPPKQIKGADPLQFMLLDAVDQALVHSGYRDRDYDRSRTGMIVGSVFGGEFGNQLQMGIRLQEFLSDLRGRLEMIGIADQQIRELSEAYGDLLLKRMPALLDETGSFTSSTLASRCTKTFDLMGGATAIDSGDTSGIAALHLASTMLHTGHTDMMIVAAGQRSAGFSLFDYYCERSLVSTDSTVRPLFEPHGTLPGEGVGVLVVKLLEKAERDGDVVHAVIRGFGAASGGTIAENTQRSITRAMRLSETQVNEIGLVEATASGDKTYDQGMLQGLMSTFPAAITGSGQKSNSAHIRTIADSTGALGGASAMAAMLRAAESVKSKTIAPLLHLPDQLQSDVATRFTLSQQQEDMPLVAPGIAAAAVVTSLQDETLAYSAVISSCEFAKTSQARNSVKRKPVVARPSNVVAASSQLSVSAPAFGASAAWRIVTLGAATVSELLANLDAAGSDVAKAFSLGEQNFTCEDRFRLAIVARSPAELAEKIQPAWHGLQLERNLAHLAVQGIFFGMVTQQPNSVAMVFPGQGSQYAGMWMDQIDGNAVWTDAAASIDRVLRSLHMPTLHQVLVDDTEMLGTDVFRTQLAMLLGDLLAMQQIAAWGTTPDVVIGHSYGELAALLAGGVWDLSTVIRATHQRCLAIDDANLPPAALLSVGADAKTLQPLLTQFDGDVWISSCNSPQQTVVGGRVSEMTRFGEFLAGQRLPSKRLAVPCAFHTPLMQPAQAAYAAATADLPLRPARVPVLSTVSGRYESDPLRFKAGLVQQLVSPVSYVCCIERALADGCRLFIEVGPAQVLTGLNRHILARRTDCVSIAMDDRRNGSNRSLACTRAVLAVNGRLGAELRRNPVLDAFDDSAIAVGSPGGGKSVISPPIPSRLPADQRSVAWVTRSESSASNTPVLNTPVLNTPVLNTPVLSAPVAVAEQVSRHVRTIELSGTPREMGRQYGWSERDRIAQLMSLCAGTFGAGGSDLPDLSDVIPHTQQYWSEESFEELRGVSEGSGIALDSLIALNFWLYPDIEAGCAHFLVPAYNTSDAWWHGANEDLPIGLTLRGPLPRSVCIRRPHDGLTHVLFTVAGQVGAIAGFNHAGLSVSSSMLVDRPRSEENRFGLLHGLLIGRVLQRAGSIDEAIATISNTCRRGAWGITLHETETGKRTYVEYDGPQLDIHECREPSVLASNHAQLLAAATDTPLHSTNRLNRLAELFPATVNRFSLGQAQSALRDQHCPQRERETVYPTMHTISRVDNQASIVMAPAEAKAWIAVTDPALLGTQRSDRSATHVGSTSLEDAARISNRRLENDRFVEIDFRPFGFCTLAEMKTRRNVQVPPVELDNGNDEVLARNSQQDADWQLLSPAEFVRLATSDHDRSPVDSNERICNRFVLRMVPLRLSEQDPNSNAKTSIGVVLVLGDGLLAEHVHRKLVISGRSAILQSTANPVETIVENIQQAYGPHHTLHVIVAECGPRNVESQTSDRRSSTEFLRQTDEQISHGLLAPYHVLQWWYGNLVKEKLTAQASCFGVIRTAGDFGLSGRIESLADGGLTGLIKAIRLENQVGLNDNFAAGTIDIHPNIDLDEAAIMVLDEWRAQCGEAEVGYDQKGVRHVLRPINIPVESRSDDQQTTPLILDQITGAWIVTGGARGVTAAVASAIGQRVLGTLHLVGSSSPPEIDPAWCEFDESQLRALRTQVMREAIAEKVIPAERWSAIEKAIEIRKTLNRFTADSIRCQYWGCDVSDRQSLNATLQQIREIGEPIVGVIHGAGFEKSNKFSAKKPELVRRTIDTKVTGCAALMELTADDPLKAFVIFGSISGRFGGVGQTDYCTANEAVAKLGSWFGRQRPETRVVTLAWHSWDEVGMAVRPETKHAKAMMNMRYMSVAEGVNHLIDELQSGSGETDVTITDWRHYKTFYPDPVWNEQPVADLIENHTQLGSSRRSTAPVKHAPSLQRLVPRIRAMSRQSNHPVALTGHTVVLGDNPDAEAVTAAMGQAGRAVTLIASRDLETAEREFQQQLTQSDLRHLVICTARESEAWHVSDRAGWDSRSERGLQFPLWLVDQWLQSSNTHPSSDRTLSLLTCLGGDFGIHARPLGIEGAALAESLWHRGQTHGIKLKIIDVGLGVSPPKLATQFLAELTSGDPASCVSIADDGVRGTLVSHSQPLPLQAANLPQPGAVWIAVMQGDAWCESLVSKFAERFSLNMHFCQLDERFPLSERLAQVRKEAGRPHGILHLANSGDVLAQTSTTKLLLDLTRQDPLTTFLSVGTVPADHDEHVDGVGALIADLRYARPTLMATRVCFESIDGQFVGSLDDAMEQLCCELSNRCPEVAVRVLAGIDDETSSLPLMQKRNHALSTAKREFEIELDAKTDPFLYEHQFRSRPLMPLVASIEAIAEATYGQRLDAGDPIVLTDIAIVNGLPVHKDAKQSCRVQLEDYEEGTKASLVADFVNSRQVTVQKDQPRVSAMIPRCTPRIAPEGLFFDSPVFWAPAKFRDEEVIYHGPPFRALKQVCSTSCGMLGQLTAPDPTELFGSQRTGQPLTPLAILDSCLFTAGTLLWMQEPHQVGIPMGIEMLQVNRTPAQNETLLVRMRVVDKSANLAKLDFDVWDYSGVVVLRVRGYKCALVRGAQS